MDAVTGKKFVTLLLCGILSVTLCSCSVRKVMVSEVAEVVEAGLSSFEQDDDLEMLEKAFPANIKLMESLHASSPDDTKLLVLLSRLYASYTFLFVEGEIETLSFKKEGCKGVRQKVRGLRKHVRKYYLKGADYALKALELRHPGCGDRLKQVGTREKFFKALTVDDVAALFWYGFNLGSFVNNSRQSIKAVAKAPLAEGAIKRVLELDPSYFHGTSHLFLLGYYASRPPMMGGNLKAALMHYEKLKELSGDGFLLADLYYARFYLYQKQEREKFREVLTGILAYREKQKEYRLFNKVAVKRANAYLVAVDQLFD